MSRPYLLIGNWKCNGSLSSVKALSTAVAEGLQKMDCRGLEVLCAPTMMHLVPVLGYVDGSKLGVSSQNVSANPNGAYTGEVSAEQLVDAGIKWTIIGHSERRQSERIMSFESNFLVSQKAKIAMAAGLSVCVCVGETETERKENKTFEVLEEQLRALIPSISDWTKFSLAYEPLWAIGTGNTATAKQAQDVHAFVRSFIAKVVNPEVAAALQICYGGSVKPKNSAELISMEDIDGFLVGGASLKPDSFLAIAGSMAK
mmetsp:Transcript_14995/g.26983  ORF Transcript_14995/g.26983 Transcript_14995/m.26983 type:complete len:258 (-) Transcript_14995:369-1142(-)